MTLQWLRIDESVRHAAIWQSCFLKLMHNETNEWACTQGSSGNVALRSCCLQKTSSTVESKVRLLWIQFDGWQVSSTVESAMSRFVHSKSNLIIWRTAWPLHIQYAWLKANSDSADYWTANLTSDNPVWLVQSCFDSPKSSWWVTCTSWTNMRLLKLLFDCWQACLSFEIQIGLPEHGFVRLQSCMWLLNIEFDCWISKLIVGHWIWLWRGTFDHQNAALIVRSSFWSSKG